MPHGFFDFGNRFGRGGVSLASEVRDQHMKGVTLEGVAAIKVIGKALGPLTERGVIKPEEYPLCRFLYSVVEEDAPLEIPWDKFFHDLT